MRSLINNKFIILFKSLESRLKDFLNNSVAFAEFQSFKKDEPHKYNASNELKETLNLVSKNFINLQKNNPTKIFLQILFPSA